MLAIDFGPPLPGATWWPRTRDWLHRVDGRYSGMAWHRDDAGTWTVDQDDSVEVDRYLYSRSNAYANALRVDPDRTLREADRGGAEMSGTTLTPGRGQTTVTLSIGVVDSLDARTALIRQVRRRHRASSETRITRHCEPIPLD